MSRSPIGEVLFARDEGDDGDATDPSPLLDRMLNHPSGRCGRRLRGGDRAACSTSASMSGDGGRFLSTAPTSRSSSLSSRYGSYLGLEGDPRASDRTTSPLQMGQVLLLVVNQGVLP